MYSRPTGCPVSSAICTSTGRYVDLINICFTFLFVIFHTLFRFLIVPNVLEELNGQKLRLYRHPNFVRGQPELIDQIQRHGAREDRLRAKQSQFRPHQSSTTPRSPATPEPLRSTVSLKPTDGSQLLKVGLQLVPAILRIQLGPNATVSQTVVEPARQEEEVEPFDDLLQLPLYTDDFRASQDWNSQSGRIFQSALFPQSCTDEMAVLAYLRLL